MSGFNKTVHYRDGKSGKVINKDPYRLYVTKQGGDSIRIFERNGVKYYENGQVVEEAPQAPEATLDAVVSKIAQEPIAAAPKVAAPVAAKVAVEPAPKVAVGG